MRRVVSVIFLALGGWLLMAEPIIAFMDFGSDLKGARPLLLLIEIVMAGVPLALGVLLSPGERRRELGLTILLAVGAALFCGVSIAAMLVDPEFKQFMPLMPPMPKLGIAPIAGIINLLILTAIGWLLYRQRPSVTRAVQRPR